MGYWLKLYTDILDDPKYFKLSKEAKLSMYELLLVAKKIEDGELTGQLPPIEDIAFYTRRPVEEWKQIIPELVSIGMVSDDENPIIKNYIKRQGVIPPEERMKQHRKKINDSAMDKTGMQRECNGNETSRNGEKNKIREETDKETDKNTELTPKQSFNKKFLDIVRVDFMTTDQPKHLTDIVEDYGEEKVLEVAAWCQSKYMTSMAAVLTSMDSALKRGWKDKPKLPQTARQMLNEELEKLEKQEAGCQKSN